MPLRKKIEAIAKQNGLYRIGVASIDRFERAPAGLSPLDLLPSARSVISLSIKLPKGVLEAKQQAYKKGFRPALYSYMVFGYSHPNSILEQSAFMVASALEEEGYLGVPVPASRPADLVNLKGAISHRHVAVAAGIADFGWNGLAITRETGPRIRFISVITDAPLSPDSLIKGKICDPKRCHYECIEACPLKAFKQGEVLSLNIGDKEVSYFGLKKWCCILGTYGLQKATMGVIDFPALENPDRESFLMASNQAVKEGRESERIGSCGLCLDSCPIGTNRW